MADQSPPARRVWRPQWLNARLVGGVLLVLVSVVAGARLFAGADRYAQVWLTAHPLSPGEQVTAADLTVGRVQLYGADRFYIDADRPFPGGYVAVRAVGAHELLPFDAVAPATAVTGVRDVAVPVQSGHLPDWLGSGDVVDVYVTLRPGGQGSSLPGTSTLVLAGVTVQDREGGDALSAAGSTDTVVLAVPVAAVGRLVQAAENGSVDLVALPPGTGSGTALTGGPSTP